MLFGPGGLICTIGQIIANICTQKGFDMQTSGTIVSIILIGISAFLTGLNVFNKIEKENWTCKAQIGKTKTENQNSVPKAILKFKGCFFFCKNIFMNIKRPKRSFIFQILKSKSTKAENRFSSLDFSW